MENSRCPVCNVLLPSDDAIREHLAGKKHLARVAFQKSRAAAAAKSIFVTGFKLGTIDMALSDYFGKFGSVSNVIIDKNKGRYAIIEFASEESAKAAINEVPHNLQGRRLLVKPRELRPSTCTQKNIQDKQGEKSSVALKPETILQELKSIPTTTEQIYKLVELISLTPTDLAQRWDLQMQIQNTLQCYFPSCQVHLFGSTFTGLGFKGCDVDIILDFGTQDENKPHDETKPRVTPNLQQFDAGMVTTKELSQLPTEGKLHFIRNIIRRRLPGTKQVLLIPSARCPIVKFYHIWLGVSCDLSCKSRLSLYNTQLIKLYCDLDGRVLPLTMALRLWGKLLGLTGSGHHLTNYAFTLMIMFYLQTREPPVIPSLQTLRQLADTQDVVDGWDCSFCKDLDKIPKSENQQTLDDLLCGFFQFYASFDFTFNIISIKDSKLVPKSDMMSSEEQYAKDFKLGPLCIQDPFDLSHNVAANLNDNQLVVLVDRMQAASHVCSEGSVEAGMLSSLLMAAPIKGKSWSVSSSCASHPLGNTNTGTTTQQSAIHSFDVPLKSSIFESLLSSAASGEKSEADIKQKCLQAVCSLVVQIFEKAFLFECQVIKPCSVTSNWHKRKGEDDHGQDKKFCTNPKEDRGLTCNIKSKMQFEEGDNYSLGKSDGDGETGDPKLKCVIVEDDASTNASLLELMCQAYYPTWTSRKKLRKKWNSKQHDLSILDVQNKVSLSIAKMSGDKPKMPVIEFTCTLRTEQKGSLLIVVFEFIPIINPKEFGSVFLCLRATIQRLFEHCASLDFNS